MEKKSATNIYSNTPDHYEAMMTTELETLIFRTVANEIKSRINSENTLILDLCCGTGLLPQMLINLKNIEYVGVDINQQFLESAQKKQKGTII